MRTEQMSEQITEPQKKCMNSEQSFQWLSKLGLEMETSLPEGEILPVLVVIPEMYRERVVEKVSNSLVPSFVIIRHPIKVSTFSKPPFNRVYIGSNRTYDTYSIDLISQKILNGPTKQRDSTTHHEFGSDYPLIIINNHNRVILEKLGCKFDW